MAIHKIPKASQFPVPKEIADELSIEGYVTIEGLVFKARASGDFLAVVKHANAQGEIVGKNAVEIPVTLLMNAAGQLAVMGMKEGVRQLTSGEFTEHLSAMIQTIKSKVSG